MKAEEQHKSLIKNTYKLGVMDQEGRSYKACYDVNVEEVVEYEIEDKV